MLVRSSRVLLLTVLVVVVALVAPRGKAGAATPVGPKYYYLALGDSLAFGYQPNGDWSHGYADDFYAYLHNLPGQPTKSLTNMACIGETSTTFINGGCPYWYLRKTFYTGSQRDAAVSFITAHGGQVSPVTLDIGGNDMLPLVNSSNCMVSNWSTALSTFNTNFTNILSTLAKALNGWGDLLVMNYYDPYQNLCPGTVDDIETLNKNIASDASSCTYKPNSYSPTTSCNVQVVDVFTAFGGATTPNPNISTYTWMNQDIHPRTPGYSVIATTYEKTPGYGQ